MLEICLGSAIVPFLERLAYLIDPAPLHHWAVGILFDSAQRDP